MRRLHRHLGRDSRPRFQSTSVPEEHIGWGNRQDPLPGRPRVLLKRKPHAVRIPRPRARLLATLRHSRLPTRRVFPSRGLSLSASADGTCSFNGPYRAPAGRSARERDHVRSERRPAYALTAPDSPAAPRSSRRAAPAASWSASSGGIPAWSSRRPPCTPASRYAPLAEHCGARRGVPCPASGRTPGRR